jgi:hypothetical protein
MDATYFQLSDQLPEGKTGIFLISETRHSVWNLKSPPIFRRAISNAITGLEFRTGS